MVTPLVAGVDGARSQQSRTQARPSSAIQPLCTISGASPPPSGPYSFFTCRKRILRADNAVDFNSMIWGFPITQHTSMSTLTDPRWALSPGPCPVPFPPSSSLSLTQPNIYRVCDLKGAGLCWLQPVFARLSNVQEATWRQ